MSAGWEAVSLDTLDAIPVAGVVWHPIRRRLGIRAFGMNAYTAEHPGGHVVEPHDELNPAERSPDGSGGHEEVYLVVRGHARFTLGGETLDAPAGTLVFIRDPAVRREAVSAADDTLVLAVGGQAGKAFEISGWETSFAASPALKAERWDEAIEILEAGLAEHPGNGSILFNLACAKARSGRPDEALAHLVTAIADRPDLAAVAHRDPDLESLRTHPGFPVAPAS